MARLRPADGPFFPFQRSSLLYLLVLSLFASSAIAVAPKISRYDAREQQFEFGGAKVKALTVTATFDQSLYFSPVSTSYKPNRSPPLCHARSLRVNSDFIIFSSD